MSRIPPVTPAEWTDAVLDVYSIVDGPEAREKGSPYKVIQTLANHPDLAIPFLHFSKHLLRASSLPGRLREIITLRVAWLYRSEYEWSEHVVMGQRVGMTAQEVAAVRDHGADWPGWSSLERSALRAVDQLRNDSTIDDETWNALAEVFDRRQLMDFVFTVGCYGMLAMALNAIGLEPEPYHKGFVEP